MSEQETASCVKRKLAEKKRRPISAESPLLLASSVCSQIFLEHGPLPRVLVKMSPGYSEEKNTDLLLMEKSYPGVKKGGISMGMLERCTVDQEVNT